MCYCWDSPLKDLSKFSKLLDLGYIPRFLFRSCQDPFVSMTTVMQKISRVTASNTYSSKQFVETSEQKKSTRCVLLFASPFTVPLLRPPRNLLVKSQTYSGATKTSRWPPRPAMAFSRDRGRGPVGSKEQLPFTLFMENKSCSRKLEVRIP